MTLVGSLYVQKSHSTMYCDCLKPRTVSNPIYSIHGGGAKVTRCHDKGHDGPCLVWCIQGCCKLKITGTACTDPADMVILLYIYSHCIFYVLS